LVVLLGVPGCSGSGDSDIKDESQGTLPTGASSSSSSGAPSGSGGTAQPGVFNACINGQGYSCKPGPAAEKCMGFAVDVCMNTCAKAGVEADPDCYLRCAIKSQNTKHDCSDCTKTACP